MTYDLLGRDSANTCRRQERLVRWHRVRYWLSRLDPDDLHRSPLGGISWRRKVGPRFTDMRVLLAVDPRADPYLTGTVAGELRYQLCHDCRLAWVGKITVHEHWKRRGIAIAMLRAVRHEASGYRWATSGHRKAVKAFWAKVHERLGGGYEPQLRCDHMKAGRREPA